MKATKKASVLKWVFDGKAQMRIAFANKNAFDVLYSFFCDSHEHMKVHIFDIVSDGVSFIVDAKKHLDIMATAKATAWADVEHRAEVILIRKWNKLQKADASASKNLSKAIKSMTKNRIKPRECV